MIRRRDSLRGHLIAALACALALAVAGCATGEDPNFTGDGGALTDARADVRTDGAMMDAGVTCRSNADCTTGAARICDTSLRRCVECMPTTDTCRMGQVCDPMARVCVMGCRSSADCGGSSSADASVLPDGAVPSVGRTQCLVAERRCVQCLTSDHCPQGTVCSSNACVPGCSATRPCPGGLDCCGGQCVTTQSNRMHCGACGRACGGAFPDCCGGRCSNTQTEALNCGGCGMACAPMHAMGGCMAGVCRIGMCDRGWADLDGMTANGCECEVGVGAQNCDGAADAGMLMESGTAMQRGVIRMPGVDHWYRVAFAPGGIRHVRFMTNPGGAYRFEVLASCVASSRFSCPDRMEGAVGLTEWEMRDTPGMHNSRMTPFPATAFVRVFTTAMATRCEPYVLALSN